jgi:hypothetical protein
MPENEILAEIRQTREAIAREHDFDVAKLFAHFRELGEKLKAEGWRFEEAPPCDTATPSASSIVREEPPAQ